MINLMTSSNEHIRGNVIAGGPSQYDVQGARKP